MTAARIMDEPPMTCCHAAQWGPPIARTSSAGSAHTQWCDQEIGDISSAARALSDSAQAWG